MNSGRSRRSHWASFCRAARRKRCATAHAGSASLSCCCRCGALHDGAHAACAAKASRRGRRDAVGDKTKLLPNWRAAPGRTSPAPSGESLHEQDHTSALRGLCEVYDKWAGPNRASGRSTNGRPVVLPDAGRLKTSQRCAGAISAPYRVSNSAAETGVSRGSFRCFQRPWQDSPINDA